MAALLHIVDLNRRALPVRRPAELNRAISRRVTPSVVAAAAARPPLIANWYIGVDGRPVCAWRFASPAPDFPSG